MITLTLTLLAHVSRLTRSSMIEVLDSTYVKVARARGLPERVVIMHHALRNALLPSITVLAQDFGFLIGGIVAVETIFAYPGLGRMLIFSLERQDLPLMQAAHSRPHRGLLHRQPHRRPAVWRVQPAHTLWWRR